MLLLCVFVAACTVCCRCCYCVCLWLRVQFVADVVTVCVCGCVYNLLQKLLLCVFVAVCTVCCRCCYCVCLWLRVQSVADVVTVLVCCVVSLCGVESCITVYYTSKHCSDMYSFII